MAGFGGAAAYLVQKAHGQVVWQVDAAKCVNSRLGEVGVEVCGRCVTDCVVSLSAVRAVNEYSKCGRCAICPAYFNITSAVDERGLPEREASARATRSSASRSAKSTRRTPPITIFEYVIDEEKCDGCGRCVMGCKEPLGLGSIVLRVRYDRCVDCNRCAISTACPKDALLQIPVDEALKAVEIQRHA